MSSHSPLDSHTLSLMDSVLSTKPPYWSTIPRWLESDEVQLVPALWHISLTQWQLRWMELKEMKKRESAGRKEVREEVTVWRTERRGYGNTGGVNGRWRVNPYEYRRMGGEVLVPGGEKIRPGEASMISSDAAPSHDFHAVSHRMEGESLVPGGEESHPGEALMVSGDAAPSHDFHVHHRMERESLVVSGGQFHPRSSPSHDFHASTHRMEGESLVATPSHDFHAVSHRMERESLVAPGRQLHPTEASMVARNAIPPANEDAPPQDFQAFLMGIEGTPFLNLMEEAGRFAQQRRR